MLVSQNFNPYNVNSKPQVGFRSKADAAKKVFKPQTVEDILAARRVKNAEGSKGSLDKAVEKAVEKIDKLFKSKK